MDSAAASALIVANVLLRIATKTVNRSVLDKQANEIYKLSCGQHLTMCPTKTSHHQDWSEIAVKVICNGAALSIAASVSRCYGDSRAASKPEASRPKYT